jgi:osmotically-inducible protein OsmY
VQVKDGWVTLTGAVDRQFESDKAFDHIAAVRGVTGVTNKIRVDEPL